MQTGIGAAELSSLREPGVAPTLKSLISLLFRSIRSIRRTFVAISRASLCLPVPPMPQTTSPNLSASPRWFRCAAAAAGFSVLAACAGAAWWFWSGRPPPTPSPRFVFRDGFEDTTKTEELYRDHTGRWQGVELQAGSGPDTNVVALTTERAHSGRSALKFVAAPFDGKKASEADIEREGLRFVKGDDVWFSAWYWLECNSEASSIFLWDLESTALRNTPGRRLFLQDGEMVASDLGKWWTSKKFRAAHGAPKFPKDRWVEVKIHLHLSDGSDGRMQVWQDGVKVLDEAGKTLPRAKTVYDRMQVGVTANTGRTNAQTLFVDDVVLSNRPL
ncbi:MAG: hypothetical protein CK548_07720 [Opitutia bacterium]|nr:hypothetical protein [Opitutaceae bacterium]PHX71065.1 MAG: hypothetical protein CK548_07720 [Opitutae bacterium]